MRAVRARRSLGVDLSRCLSRHGCSWVGFADSKREDIMPISLQSGIWRLRVSHGSRIDSLLPEVVTVVKHTCKYLIRVGELTSV